jgi:hypothetical protein
MYKISRYICLSRSERTEEHRILFCSDLQGSQLWRGNTLQNVWWDHRNILRHKAVVLVLSAAGLFASWFNIYSFIRAGQRRWILKREKAYTSWLQELVLRRCSSGCLQQVERFRDLCNSSAWEYLFWGNSCRISVRRPTLPSAVKKE